MANAAVASAQERGAQLKRENIVIRTYDLWKTYLMGEDGRRIDLGLVGEVKNVNARLLQLLVQADAIPVIATIARDQAGGRLNVNADTAAGAVAAAMKAEKLVVISDTHGIRSDPKDPESRVSKMKQQDRNYRILDYLNVIPRTSYLARLRNPNPKMPDAKEVGIASMVEALPE